MHRCYLPLIIAFFTLPLIAQEPLCSVNPRPTHPTDKTEIKVDALFSIAAPTGYLPVRITAVNQQKSGGQITVNTSSTSGPQDDDSRVTSEFSFPVAEESVSTHDLLVPLTTVLGDGRLSSGSTVELVIGGSFGRNEGNLHSNFGDEAAAVMMSEKLHTPNASILDAELNRRHSGSSRPTFAGRFDPLRMPEDWRAYSGYDAFLMTDDDWNKLGAGARNAILQWCRLGGELVIYRLNSSSNYASLGIDSDGDSFGYGTIRLESIRATLALDAPKLVNHFLKAPTIPPQNKSIRNDYSGAWPLHGSFGAQKFAYGIFIVVLIGFGILVGPVNLFVFAKSGMRHKLFITTPIISLATSALLILLILLKDGTGGRGERIALIEVRPDSGENNAYVIQEQISRTGVLLGASFSLDEAAAITPVPISDSAWARLNRSNEGGGMRYTANFDDGKLAVTGDWFQSRSEQGQLIRSVIPTRGRIEIKSSGGTPILLSTFDFPIESIYYTDRSNGYWLASDLKPGNKVTCTPISEREFKNAIGDQSTRFGERNRRTLNLASTRPDHYVAIATEAPAVETIDSIDWSRTHTILTGPVLR
ncbi:hypothetical protein ACFQY0_03850 [Haloferula chungangensis]|uniref:DUF2207 domain-containing protein n=1 Tax=Haloferula chungangensis TaxID=1048331 RepID=A0ABW2L1T9_9BACT